ncbi:hypothetical protein [Chitinophaga sp.]|uniref:hypothetical protein n=1 Tax=Chitinophaga sp. TaxID=1869181 RepID=UPI002F92A92E
MFRTIRRWMSIFGDWFYIKKSDYYIRREEKFMLNHQHVWETDLGNWGYRCTYKCCDAFIVAELAYKVGITDARH